jgi:hypothetical protein
LWGAQVTLEPGAEPQWVWHNHDRELALSRNLSALWEVMTTGDSAQRAN